MRSGVKVEETGWDQLEGNKSTKADAALRGAETQKGFLIIEKEKCNFFYLSDVAF